MIRAVVIVCALGFEEHRPLVTGVDPKAVERAAQVRDRMENDSGVGPDQKRAGENRHWVWIVAVVEDFDGTFSTRGRWRWGRGVRRLCCRHSTINDDDRPRHSGMNRAVVLDGPGGIECIGER